MCDNSYPTPEQVHVHLTLVQGCIFIVRLCPEVKLKARFVRPTSGLNLPEIRPIISHVCKIRGMEQG